MQLTRDAGAHWTDTTRKVAAAGGPEDAWVSRVYGSRFEPGTAYITKSRRRQDDFRSYVFRTTDFGATWTRVVNGLPASAEANASDSASSAAPTSRLRATSRAISFP